MNKQTFFAFLQFIDSSFPNMPTPAEKAACLQQDLEAMQERDRAFSANTEATPPK